MKALNKIIKISSKKLFDFVDITEEVEHFVRESKIKDGLVNVQILHTSAALIVNENEPLLWEDFKSHLEKTASRESECQHDNLNKRTVNLCADECINGHSHCKAIHLLVSATLNLIKGKVQLGKWQRIIFVELDRARERRIQIQIIGV